MNDPKKNESQTLDDKIAQAMERAMEKVIPAAIMAAGQVSGNALAAATGNSPDAIKSREALAQAKMDALVQCQDCGQKRVACKGEHVQMFVGPKNARRVKWFPGCYLNGVQYISTHPGHRVVVPKDNNFAHQIASWEQSEEDLRTGREIRHNSGIISPSGTSGFKPYTGAGFNQ